MQLSSSTFLALVLLYIRHEAYSLPLESSALEGRSPAPPSLKSVVNTVIAAGKAQAPKVPPKIAPFSSSASVLKKGSSSAPPSPKSQSAWKAGDLKTSQADYTKTALNSNKPGGFAPSADGKSVQWDDKLGRGRGKDKSHVEHIIQPDHVIPALEKLNVGKDHPLAEAAKKHLNSADNLSMLQGDLNRVKHSMTVGNKLNEKDQGKVHAVNDYWDKVHGQKDRTLEALDLAGKEHGHPKFGDHVKEQLEKSFPSRPGTPTSEKKETKEKKKRQFMDFEEELASRSVDDEFDLVARFFDDFELDELE